MLLSVFIERGFSLFITLCTYLSQIARNQASISSKILMKWYPSEAERHIPFHVNMSYSLIITVLLSLVEWAPELIHEKITPNNEPC